MLHGEIERVREGGPEAGRFPNEGSVSQGVVLRLLHALGWPSYVVDIVAPASAGISRYGWADKGPGALVPTGSIQGPRRNRNIAG